MTFHTTLKIATAILLTTSLAFAQRGEGQRAGDLRTTGKLRVGDPAPDFKLKTKDGSREVQLSSFKGKGPVVLVFGSYT